MDLLIILGVGVLLYIYFIAQDSNKETTKEKYGEAIGHVAHSTADSIARIAHDIAEPAKKKELRLAKEALAYRNGQLYRYEYYSQKEHIEKLLTVDGAFKSSLDKLGITEKRWLKIGKHMFYVGAIIKLSRDSFDYSKKNSENMRYDILHNWDDCLKEYSDTLKEALAYFNISETEWIKYGDAVINMYNINDNRDIEEDGYISQILPMKNNKHLL